MPAWNVFLPISTLVANATAGTTVTYNDVIEQTMTIVRSCTTFSSSDTVLLTGEYEDFLQRSLLDGLSVALVSESKSSTLDLFTRRRYSFEVFKQPSFLRLMWKLDRFVVVASSQSSLRVLLQKMKDTGWANFMGFHVLIDRRTEERGCTNAYKFLWTAWEYDLLSTIFLCIDPVEGLVLYTYNPYSTTAPRVWQDAGQFSGRGGHPWVLLKRKYQGSKTCKDLTFDRTTNLDGYEIRLNAIAFTPHLLINPALQGQDRFSGDNSEIVKIVFGKLNGSLNVREYNGTADALGGIDSQGNMLGMLGDIASGEVDMGMNVRSLRTMWRVEYTYPHGEDGLCVITRRAPKASEVVKILSFMSAPVVTGCALVCLITLCVLTKLQGFLPAILNIIRWSTTVSILGLPSNTAGRIFFSNVLILSLIINSVLQSHWSSLLTVPVPGADIKTPEQLKNSNCQIYGLKFHEDELQDPVLRSRFHVDTYDGCKEQVINLQCAACLGDCLHQYRRIDKQRYLRRSNTIQQRVRVYVTRENWPLYTTVSRVIHSTVEAGLVTMWQKLNTRGTRRQWQRRKLNDNRSFRPLERKHISFSFYVLAVGYSCAAVAFVVEVIVDKQRVRGKRETRE